MPDDRPSFDQTTLASPGGDSVPAVPSTERSVDGSLDGWLPSRPASVAGDSRPTALDPLELGPGGRIGEFVVEKTLGRGGFGVVYLARQLSLDRHVALKVVAKQGAGAEGEGRSLARLEHDNIVQVYAESVEPTSGARMLCMQYVAGTTLATVVRELKKFESGVWSGADLLAVLDGLGLPPTLFDPDAMRDRDFLASADHVEAVCRIGEQLACALHHAHERGVLHRDVKPANVLVNRYGRPLLADFNLATRDADEDASAVFGGTLAYMAPEHLDAFNPDSPTLPEAVDARSDVYALCVVLWELASCGHPFPTPGGAVDRDDLSAVLKRLAAQRRHEPPKRPPGDRRLQRALARGLSPDPEHRYPSAESLAETMAGLREQRSAVRAFPPFDPVARWSWRHPVTALVLAGLLPQFVGSALQISYNEIQILDTFTPAQRDLFWTRLAPIYNLVAYPVCLTWLGRRLVRVVRVWQRLRREEPVSDEEVDQARTRALQLPRDTAFAACAGWFPGALIFPLVLHFGAGSLPWAVWGHFAVSFFLAGLIALTYSFFLSTGVAVRTMYVRFWSDPRNFRDRATQELAAVPDRLRTFNVLAGIIPLAGAVLLVLVGGGVLDAWFKVLTATLILAGMAGYTVVGRLSRRYLQVIDACTNGAARAVRRSTRPATAGGRLESSEGSIEASHETRAT